MTDSIRRLIARRNPHLLDIGEVSLNPQPLPPKENWLNPQPLPPREHWGPIQLNPQPLPPEPPDGALALTALLERALTTEEPGTTLLNSVRRWAQTGDLLWLAQDPQADARQDLLWGALTAAKLADGFTGEVREALDESVRVLSEAAGR